MSHSYQVHDAIYLKKQRGSFDVIQQPTQGKTADFANKFVWFHAWSNKTYASQRERC